MDWRFFAERPFLDPDLETWQIETWAWLLGHFGGTADLARSPLVEPTEAFFPPTRATGHALAEHLFDAVKRHARMADWPCDLVDQPYRPVRVIGRAAILEPIGPEMPLGTFSHDGRRATVSYDPDLLDEPVQLVATLAHELAHFRLAALPGEPPGGPEALEYATDLTTVYLGFGAFGANCAYIFEGWQFGQATGWKSSRQGYLVEREWVFSLALFLILRGEKVETLRPLLKRHLFTDLRKAYRSLMRRPALLAALR
jgi:hypothetical protein